MVARKGALLDILNMRSKSKALLIIAIVIVVFAICLTVGLNQIHADDGEVKDIYSQLANDGIDNAVFPELFDDNIEITDYEFVTDEEIDMITFNFSSEIQGRIVIQKYNNKGKYKEKKPIDVDIYEIIETNIADIMVFGDDDSNHIQYNIDSIEYSININCDFETALKIAKTI